MVVSIIGNLNEGKSTLALKIQKLLVNEGVPPENVKVIDEDLYPISMLEKVNTPAGKIIKTPILITTIQSDKEPVGAPVLWGKEEG